MVFWLLDQLTGELFAVRPEFVNHGKHLSVRIRLIAITTISGFRGEFPRPVTQASDDQRVEVGVVTAFIFVCRF